MSIFSPKKMCNITFKMKKGEKILMSLFQWIFFGKILQKLNFYPKKICFQFFQENVLQKTIKL